jgi:putative ABC transport system permease protein
MLLKSPGFTMVSVLTLALGIGANTAMFSVVNQLLLRRLPYRDPNRIVQVWTRNVSTNHLRMRPSLPDFADFKEQTRTLSKMAHYRGMVYHLTSTNQPQEIQATRVSTDFFGVLGVEPCLGRAFLSDECLPGHEQVVVLGYGLWQRRFGGQSSIIGQAIGVEGKDCIVCGVMPPDFDFPNKTEIWTPYSINSNNVNRKRDDHFDPSIARLADGVSLTAAETEMDAIAQRLEKQYPATDINQGAWLVPLQEELVGTFEPAILLLMGATGAVLLIVCANIANLQLARGASRQKEVAIRSALGASRGRIIRQMLVESIVLSIVGGACGLLVASLAKDLLIGLAPAGVPRISETRLDATVLFVSFAASVLTGILFGLVPAIRAAKVNLTADLQQGGKGASAGLGGNRLRGSLVVSEIAIAVILLLGAGLLLQSLQKLTRVSLGFDPRDLAAIHINLPWQKYHEKGTDGLFFRNLFQQLHDLPSATDSALACALPVEGRETTVDFNVLGAVIENGKHWTAGFNYVSPSYFQTMHIPLRRGRELTEQDTRESQRVVVVDESLATRYFANADPIGQSVLIEGQGNDSFVIVGIAGSIHQRDPATAPDPQLYMQYQQINEGGMWLIVRGQFNLNELHDEVAKRVQSMDADQSIGPVRTMDFFLRQSSELSRFRTVLLGLLAGLALILAAIGIYGVVAYSVSQRTAEFGLRMALGARRIDLVKLVMKQGVTLVAAGIAIGAVVALSSMRIMQSMLFEVTPSDPLTFALVLTSLAAIALLACYLPARRAARVDPMVALRHD